MKRALSARWETNMGDNKKNDGETFNSEEILLAMLVWSAPDYVQEMVKIFVSREISPNAGREVLKTMQKIRAMYNSPHELLAAMKPHVSEELKGGEPDPKEPPPDATDFLATLARSLGFPESSFDPNAIAEPTPNCSCPRCIEVRENGKKGIFRYNDGRPVPPEALH